MRCATSSPGICPESVLAQRAKVGVSRCLLGDAVRYDGRSKANLIVIEQLDALFELVPLCPEVEAGLTTPRPPVQLTCSSEAGLAHPRMTGRDDPSLDVTDLITDYCELKLAQLEQLSGFIFKSRSPSCGLDDTPVLLPEQTRLGSGVFAQAFTRAYPTIAVIDERKLEDTRLKQDFIRQVQRLHRQ